MADAIEDSHRVIALDLRGFGKSTTSGDVSQYGAEMSADLVRLLDHLNVQKAHVVGHSLGALVAASAIATDRERFLSATLVAGSFYANSESAERDLRPWVAELKAGRGLTKFLKWLLPDQTPAVIASLNAGLMGANDLPSLIAVMRSVPYLVVPASALAGVPSVLAVGMADPLAPLSRAFATRGSGLRLLEVPGAGHISVIESAEMIRSLRDLLQRAEPIRPAA